MMMCLCLFAFCVSVGPMGRGRTSADIEECVLDSRLSRTSSLRPADEHSLEKDDSFFSTVDNGSRIPENSSPPTNKSDQAGGKVNASSVTNGKDKKKKLRCHDLTDWFFRKKFTDATHRDRIKKRTLHVFFPKKILCQ